MKSFFQGIFPFSGNKDYPDGIYIARRYKNYTHFHLRVIPSIHKPVE